MQNETVAVWCNRVLRLSFFLLFALVPLLFTPVNYELFEFNKMIAVYGLTVIITASWLVKSVFQGKLRIARTPLDVPILLFLTSQLVSSLFSIDRHLSWFGYYSRFNGGMWSIISYILLYYAFVSHWVTERGRQEDSQNDRKKNTVLSYNKAGLTVLPLFRFALATATVVALYGVLERLGIDRHLWVQDVQNRVFSTLGQPNWLAAYLVALIPLAMAFGLTSHITHHKTQLGYWILTAALFFVVLLFTRSRSGLLGFAVADVIFWSLLFWKVVDKKNLRSPFVICHLLFFMVIFLNGTSIASIDRVLTLDAWKKRISNIAIKQYNNEAIAPEAQTPSGTLLEVGGTESSTIRKYVWQAATAAWRGSTKTFLIGTGTETFALAFYQHKPKNHNLTSEWDFLYNKAHNEYLNYLATTGLFGLSSYLLFIGSFIWWFARNVYGFMNHKLLTINLALFAGWASILVTNFFGFSVVVTQLFLFLFPAFVLLPTIQHYNTIPVPPKLRRWLVVGVTIVAGFLLFGVAQYWFADLNFANGYRLSRLKNFPKAERYLRRAISLRSIEPVYRDELSSVLSSLTVEAFANRDATKAAELMDESLKESDAVLAASPNNVNFWKTRVKIFHSFSDIDPQFHAAALEALKHARDLSPLDPKIAYNLAILAGRIGDNTKAIDYLRSSIELKPNYRDPYYALWVFYQETKQREKATEVMRTYLTAVDPSDKEFQNLLSP